MMNNKGSTFPQIYAIVGVAWVLIVIMIMVVMGMGGEPNEIGDSEEGVVQLSPSSEGGGGNIYIWVVLLVLLLAGIGIIIFGLVKGKKEEGLETKVAE
jgi:hypothetical protein